MTEEELEEAADHAETKMVVECNGDYTKFKKYKDGFIDGLLAGLKEGKPKWHDLRKDLNDLPKNRRNVWITYINAYHQTETTEASFRYKYWVINGHRTECDVIAWCEIPKFEEE